MPYDTEVLADAPIVYWRLDDAVATTAVDSSGNALDGTEVAAGLTALQTALINDGTSFDFDADYLASASDALLQLDVDFTFEFWIQFDSGDPLSGQLLPMSLLGTGNRAITMEDTRDQIDVTDFNGHSATLTFTALAYDTPHHIVVTYDDSSGAVEAFVNGVSVDTGTVAAPGLDPQATPSQLTFGSGLLSSDHWLGDEAAVYDTVLSSTRVGIHYTAGFGGGGTPTYEEEVMADTPELYWRLDEVTATTATDTSGNGHTGTTTTSGGGTAVALIDGLISQGTAWELSDQGATPIAYVESTASSALAPSGDFTFELWVEFPSTPVGTTGLVSVASVNGRYLSMFDDMETFVLQDAAGGNAVSLTTVDPLSPDTPYHIVVTYDVSATTAELWLDGVSQDTGMPTPTATFSAIGTPASTRFTTEGVTSGPDTDIIYDEIALYLAVLPTGRIVAHYEAGLLVYNNAALLGVARQSTTGGVFLSQPGEQIADIQAQLLDIDDMDAVVLQLDQAVDYTWQDPFSEPGAGRIELMNDDPDLPSIVAQSLVRFDYKGWAAFTMICEQYARTTVSQNEESGESTIWEGRGHLALLERGLVYPTSGVGRLPIEEDRTFNWASPVYDDSAWLTPNVKGLYGSSPGLTYPAEDWPDATALHIWSPQSSGGADRSGFVYFRKTFTCATDMTIGIYGHADDRATYYLDGQIVLRSDNNVVGGTAQHPARVSIDVTAGTHLIAVEVLNYWWFSYPIDVDPSPGVPVFIPNNVGDLLVAIYEMNLDLSPATLLVHTDATWRMADYPLTTPGMTPGEVMRVCVDEMQARGVLPGLNLTFTDTADSDGNPWPEVADIATKVGTDVLTFFREMAGTYVDMWMEPGALNLSAWNYGGRGQVRPVAIESPTDPNDPDSGNLTTLVHKGTG